ncbi:MAG TPA: hypothetical protein VIL42_00840 [Sphingomicrobium sp.]
MDDRDQEYYRQRELSERAAAKSAACPDARRVHHELAQNYAALARGEAEMPYIGPGSRRRPIGTIG